MPARSPSPIRPSLLIGLGTAVFLAVVAVIALPLWKTAPPTGSSVLPAQLVGPERVGAAWLKPVGAEADFVGDEACRPCHQEQFKTFGQAPHSHTVRRLQRDERLSEFHSRVEVVDETVPAVYRLQPAGDANRLVAARPEKIERVAPHWMFGSGAHAHTYVAEGPSRFIELRLSYYPPVRKWNLTPGQGKIDATHTALGAVYTPLGIASCFGCHSTVLVGTPEALDLERSRLNVGCEACHGAGKAHVDSALRLASGGALADLARPNALRGSESMETCVRCHRSNEDFAPGDPSFEAQIARFAGPALTRSRCFTESAGKMSCVTCHNPHAPAAKGPSSYDAACFQCHQRAGSTACKAGKLSACVSCHMPEQSIARKLPLRFHNHWIRVFERAAEKPPAHP